MNTAHQEKRVQQILTFQSRADYVAAQSLIEQYLGEKGVSVAYQGEKRRVVQYDAGGGYPVKRLDSQIKHLIFSQPTFWVNVYSCDLYRVAEEDRPLLKRITIEGAGGSDIMDGLRELSSGFDPHDIELVNVRSTETSVVGLETLLDLPNLKRVSLLLRIPKDGRMDNFIEGLRKKGCEVVWK